MMCDNEIKALILSKYTSINIVERFDDEVLQWVEDDWADHYETEYDWYLDYGNGEAESVVIKEIADEFNLLIDKVPHILEDIAGGVINWI